MARLATLLLGCLALGACRVMPAHGYRLRPDGVAPGWTTVDAMHLQTSLRGAAVTVDLSGETARILVTIENETAADVEIRMGVQATGARGSIGEVLQRPLGAVAGLGGPDYAPYESMQAITVKQGWRATFSLDAPFDREPTYGLYFVFDVEARSSNGPVERRSLPLVVAHFEASERDRR
ncbi:MAG: hypothetical protein KDC98_01775 [Planctomycetes bacterium]|nr:hypothetical protein [Planctomycetota bacterium]